MRYCKKYYNESPEKAAWVALAGAACLFVMVRGFVDLTVANFRFDENNCEMVLNNSTRKRLLTPVTPASYYQSDYTCPSSPAICNESCNNSGNAAIEVLLSSAGLFLCMMAPLMTPGLNKVMDVLKAKSVELGLFSRTSAGSSLLSAGQENASNGTFNPNQNV